MTTTYLIYPRVLKGFEIDLWQANHPLPSKLCFTRGNVDGITDPKLRYYSIPKDFFKPLNFEVSLDFELLEEEDI